MNRATRGAGPSAPEPFTVLHRGRFGPAQLRLHVVGGRVPRTGPQEEVLREVWDRACAEARRQGRRLFNAPLFRLVDHAERKGCLHLLLGETDYREITASRLAPSGAGLGEADGLAVCTALVTADDLLVLGRRGRAVDRGAGRLHVCAGHPDPSRLLVPEVLGAGRNPLFEAVRRELSEEFGVMRAEIAAMECRGLIRSRPDGKPELVFETRVDLAWPEIRERHGRAPDRYEHRELLAVPADTASLQAFVEAHRPEFTPPGLAALVLGSPLEE